MPAIRFILQENKQKGKSARKDTMQAVPVIQKGVWAVLNGYG